MAFLSGIDCDAARCACLPVCCGGCSYYLLYQFRNASGVASAAIVSAINVGLPIFIKGVVAGIEVHVDQSDLQVGAAAWDHQTSSQRPFGHKNRQGLRTGGGN